MQINIINITDEEIDCLLSKLGVVRRNGVLFHNQIKAFVGTIERTHLVIDFDLLSKAWREHEQREI